MGDSILPARHPTLWKLVARQHGVVTRRQLLGLGFTAKAIKHRVAKGRLHAVRLGVYVVGRPELTQHGRWMAAVLSCGPEAILSHHDAAALFEIGRANRGRVHVTVPRHVARKRPGIVLHRRAIRREDVTRREGIPVTTPICTLVDLATRLNRREIEAAVSEVDRRGLTDPEQLRAALAKMPPRPGVRPLREALAPRTFRLTDSELERRFLLLVRAAGLPAPETQRYVNGFKVDFYWPDLGLVVETDGLRYHRTAPQQARDRLRDQAHTRAGLTQLRFTYAQVASDPDYVRATLRTVARRLAVRLA